MESQAFPEIDIADIPDLGNVLQVSHDLAVFITAIVTGDWDRLAREIIDPFGLGFADLLGLGGRPKLGPGSATQDYIRYFMRSRNPALRLYAMRIAQLEHRGIPISVSGGHGLALKEAVDAESDHNLRKQGFADPGRVRLLSCHQGCSVINGGLPLSAFDCPPGTVCETKPPGDQAMACKQALQALLRIFQLIPEAIAISVEIEALLLAFELSQVWVARAIELLLGATIKDFVSRAGGELLLLYRSSVFCLQQVQFGPPPTRRRVDPPIPTFPVPNGLVLPEENIAVTSCGSCGG